VTKPAPPVDTTLASNTVQTSNTTQASNQPTPVTTTLAGNPQSVLGKSQCLLKTAVTEVMSDTAKAVANVLFDERAQCSFISQQLADVLQLTALRQENITLAPFGADNMSPQSLSVRQKN